MSTLARDFGGAPGLLELWREHGWRVLLAYCFGASFVSFYRFMGPFRSAEAPEIAKTELMMTVKRRGVAGNFFFGVVNLIAYFLELIGLIPPEESMVTTERYAGIEKSQSVG